MAEKLIGQAERDMLGNDLFWRFLKYDDAMPGHFIDLRWTGYNDHAWWTRWSKQEDVKEQGGRRYRIDFANCNVYEVTDAQD